jgi:hypothetical protein
MTTSEMNREGWYGYPPPVIELSNGTLLYPSQDDEGNSPGALFGLGSDGDTFMLTP